MKKVLLIFACFSILKLFDAGVGCNGLGQIKSKFSIEALLEKRFLPDIFSCKVDFGNECNRVAMQAAELCPGLSKVNEELLQAKEWSNKNVDPLTINCDTVFYPFGGPDITYPVTFFRKQRFFVLVGLEPIGNFKEIQRNISNPSTSAAIQKALSSYFKKKYFITSEMMTQLSNKNIRGALYLILAALSNGGYIINSISDLSIDAEGNAIPRRTGAIDCVKIEFSSANDAIIKEVYYVRTSLTNENKKLQHLFSFLKKLRKKDMVTFTKSASYVLHDPSASATKKFILEKSRVIMQDDTGIPFKDLKMDGRKIFTYGEYDGTTIPIFAIYSQRDLAAYFESEKKTPITFDFGYGSILKQSHVIIAVHDYTSGNELRGKEHPPVRNVDQKKTQAPVASNEKTNVNTKKPARTFAVTKDNLHQILAENEQNSGEGCPCNKSQLIASKIMKNGF
ncbi:MAG: hypothetical protein LBB21_05010 [Holosporaceae bacterium]|jgi:hypothetical protein|nr:hypothetical protein [Holosporaceae bacterium]